MRVAHAVFALGVLAVAAAGCGARFVDERGPRDLAVAPAPEAGDLAGVDAGAERLIAVGRFEGRAGHVGRGGARLVSLDGAGGRLALRLDDDFEASPVPGPVVVLTAREALGTALLPGDRALGTLAAPRGAQEYPVGADGGERVAFIFCQPFGVEVARVLLEAAP